MENPQRFRQLPYLFLLFVGEDREAIRTAVPRGSRIPRGFLRGSFAWDSSCQFLKNKGFRGIS